MQNLRDKLLKAGLVTEKQAKEAERTQRPPKRHREREEKISEEERRKEAAKAAEARMQSDRARRLRQIVESNRIDDPGASMFHYVRRSGKIGRLALGSETQKLLESGGAAVVEDPGAPDCAVVAAEAAKKIYEVDPQAIRFWHGPDKPIGFSDAGE